MDAQQGTSFDFKMDVAIDVLHNKVAIGYRHNFSDYCEIDGIIMSAKIGAYNRNGISYRRISTAGMCHTERNVMMEYLWFVFDEKFSSVVSYINRQIIKDLLNADS